MPDCCRERTGSSILGGATRLTLLEMVQRRVGVWLGAILLAATRGETPEWLVAGVNVWHLCEKYDLSSEGEGGEGDADVRTENFSQGVVARGQGATGGEDIVHQQYVVNLLCIPSRK